MDGDEKKKMTLLASAWASLIARVVVIAAALGVLAGIGRAASAGPSIAPNANAETPAALATADASPPPAPTTAAPAPTPPPSSPSAERQDGPGAFRTDTGQTPELTLVGLVVGPKRAGAILALRVRVGRFRRVEDLLRVKGIGRKTIRKWRPLVRLEPRSESDAGAP